MFLNFPIIALCTELSVLLGNSKMHFDITLVAEKLKCMIVLFTTYKCMQGTSRQPPPPPPNIEKKPQKQIKVKGNNTLIFQYEQQNIENHYVF